MTIRIACAGKLKEKYFTDAASEFIKRLSRFTEVLVSEVADEKIPENASAAEEQQAIDREGKRILKTIAPGEHVIALAIGGKEYDSVGFSKHLGALMDAGKSRIAFVIGGSLGLSREVLDRADETLSLSRMTYPHRIARIVLLEQIYRAFKILKNETYHK